MRLRDGDYLTFGGDAPKVFFLKFFDCKAKALLTFSLRLTAGAGAEIREIEDYYVGDVLGT